MDKTDLETYQVQLSQVEAALQADPDNAELASLRAELQELISLTQTALAQAEEASSSKVESSRKTSSSTPTATWSAGDECMAKYSGDGSWYPARITSIGGSDQNRVFTLVFKGYNSTEQVKASELKPLPVSYIAAASLKRKHETDEEKERKKKKNEKKLETRAAKAKEQNHKQATWQKFAKKSEKKGVHIAGVSGTSIFKTPDNPLGRGICRSHSFRAPFSPSNIILI